MHIRFACLWAVCDPERFPLGALPTAPAMAVNSRCRGIFSAKARKSISPGYGGAMLRPGSTSGWGTCAGTSPVAMKEDGHD